MSKQNSHAKMGIVIGHGPKDVFVPNYQWSSLPKCLKTRQKVKPISNERLEAILNTLQSNKLGCGAVV